MGYLFIANSNGSISKQKIEKKTKIIKNDDGTLDLKYSGMQRIKNSIKSTGNLVTKGAVKEAESQLDWMNKANSKVMSGAYNLLGRKDLSQRQTENSNDFIKKDLTQKLWNKTGLQNSLENQAINGSIIKKNNIGGQIAYGLGQQGVRIAEGALLSGGANIGKIDGLDKLSKFKKIGVQLAIDAPSNVAMYTSSYGSGYEQALREGATTKQAEKYAKGSAAVEFATEMMTGGIPGTNGKGFLDYGAEKVIDKISKKASSKVANIALKYGYHIVGEGFEEAMSEILNPYLKNATYSSNEKIDWNQVWNAAVVGGVIGGILEAPGTVSELKYNKINRDEKTQIQENNTSTTNNINQNINEKSHNINGENLEQIQSEIQQLEVLEKNNNITKQQEQYLNELKKQLNYIQNQNTDTDFSLPTRENLPTVQDIVNQEKSSQSGINLPAYKQQSNINNSDKAILPTVNDFNSSNINIPTSDIKVDMAKISPEILNDIKGFKLGDPSIESYKGSYIKTMLNEVGIKVPTAMNYVSEVRPDMSFTTTKDLTRQQYSSISNALQKLRSIDVTSVNNANYSIPIGNYQYVKSSNANINELRRTASMYLNNTARSNNTIKLLENIIKDRNYIIRFNPNITNEQGVPVNGLITKENGKTIIELNPNADNYVEFLVVHEITHDIATKEMKELILDYAKQDPDFEKSLESLKERYKTDDVSDEVVADVCGELFGNREFIQSVVEKKPNIFKKILNNIRKLAEKIKGTGANEYVSFVEKLKTMWEDAYYSNRSNLNKIEYHLSENALNEVNDALNNPNTDINSMVKLRDFTPEQLVSVGVSDLPMLVRKGHLRENILTSSEAKNKGYSTKGKHYHGLGIETYMNAIDSLDNPIAVYQYTDKGNYSKDNFIVLTEVKDSDNNNIIVPIEIHKRGQYNKVEIDINKIKTTYGKNNSNYFDNMIKNGSLVEIYNKKRSAKLPIQSGNLNTSVANNIPQSNNNVNSNTSSATKYSIPTNKNNTQELNNSSFSLEQRVSGDKLLDTQDLIEEIKTVGAKVDKNGYVTLYHQTTNENADKIRQTGKMIAKEPYVYFSTSKSASQSEGRGNTKLEFKIPAEKLILDDIFDDNADVKIKLNNNKELDVSGYIISKNRNSVSNNHKQKQLEIIKNNNPVNDDYHTWIRNVEDIKTLEETINDSDWSDYDEYNPDLSRQDIENAIDSGKITVYSSYPIKQGIFVSPSKMEAESYSSNGKVYSKEVNINDVAWIDPTQGQYAKVYDVLPTKYSQSTKEWNEYLKDNFPSAGTKTKMSDIKLPIREDIKNDSKKSSILNPNEISKLTKENTKNESEKLAEILREKPTTIEEKDNWLRKLATIKFIDKGYYVDKLARKVQNKELSSKYDYSLLSNGIANQIIGNGRVDEKGNKVGKGLYEIFEPIENSGLLDDFSKYMYHKHNIDRMSLQNRFNEANKAVFGDSMTSDMSEKIVNEYENKYPEFESWANDIYEYNNANLEMLVKYGVLSKDSMEYYNKKYPHYVPTIREQTKTKTQMDFLLGKKASVNNPVKKAKGGNGNIIPLKDAMALRTMQTVNSALRNNFGLELLNSIETEQIRNQENIDNIVEEINSDDLLIKSSETSPATLTVFDKGEKVTFEISDEIYEALKPSNIKTFKFLNKLNNIRRGLLTEYNPTFMITNPLKDIQDGSINSKHPKLFIKNLPEAIKQIKNNGQYKQLYIANGGSYETYFNYNTGTNIAPSKLDKIAPLKKISEINELIEMAPRLAEFISSIEAGDSIETAMYNASEITTNFKRGGDITKTLDRNGVTFLNAGVQGTTKQVRNVQEARVEGIKGITRLAVRWTIAGLVPTLLMNMIWGDDDDYEELSDYVKNNYYIIGKYDNGEFIRIPKGRVVSVLQSFFQNALNGVEGKKMDLKGFADLIENNLLPSDPNESSLIAPIKQAINNETWYGGDLVPTRLQNLPNAEQYDETTDSISIWLGKMLNISPYKINYVLDQYAGAIGDYTLPYLTQAAESGSDSFTGKLLAPIKDKFTVDSSLKNQNISDFYSLSEELTKKSNSSSATDEDILKNKYINSVKSEISKLYAKKREIQSSSLKDSEKYNQSKEVQNEINELSEKALDNYSKVELYDNYAIINDKEYYKNNNDEWTKIDTTNAKYKTAKLITRYNDYLLYDNKIKELKKQYNSSNSRKIAIIKYVNSLDLTIPQKAMLIKMNYTSYSNYNNQIINYINEQDISIDEKKEILEELGFKVRNGRVYTK